MQNILNHNRTSFIARINKDDYWDFFLSQSNFGYKTKTDGLSDGCLISYIDTNDPDCVWFDSLISKQKYTWDEAVNNGLSLYNIGYTGVDNGLFTYEKDKISNEDFLKIFKNSVFKKDKNDLKLYLNKINGNNSILDYNNDIVEEDGRIVAKLNGGFYQGFFKTDKNYQILPSNIGNGLTFEVTLKKHEFAHEDGKYTLNNRYPSNKGIFLYIGTRAENKWWKEYINTYIPEKIENGFVTDGYINNEYTNDGDLNENYLEPFTDRYAVEEYTNDDYTSEETCGCVGCMNENEEKKVNEASHEDNDSPLFTYPEFLNTYEDNSVWFTKKRNLWIENEHFSTHNAYGSDAISSIKTEKYDVCNKYFSNEYIASDYYPDNDCSMYVSDEYIKEDIPINENEELFTSNGYSVRQPNIKEYISDNKFLLFDRTKDGFTADNWEEGSKAIITDVLTPDIGNYFLLMNRTCNGYTTKSIDELIDKESKKYNILSDIYRNAICFQITDNGEIGYKYIIRDCSEDKNYKILSQFSFPNVIKENEWVTIAITITPITREYDRCDASTISSDKMVISIYVNGKLRLISDELPVLNLRQLGVNYDLQEGVPFNISLGGGTQGLSDVVYLNYRKQPSNVLPLEKEFGGSFIGYIQSLRIYDCLLSFSEITQNYEFDNHFSH